MGFQTPRPAFPHLLEHAERRADGGHLLPRAAACRAGAGCGPRLDAALVTRATPAEVNNCILWQPPCHANKSYCSRNALLRIAGRGCRCHTMNLRGCHSRYSSREHRCWYTHCCLGSTYISNPKPQSCTHPSILSTSMSTEQPKTASLKEMVRSCRRSSPACALLRCWLPLRSVAHPVVLVAPSQRTLTRKARRSACL